MNALISTENEAILDPIKKYLDGVREGSVELLTQAFTSTATITSIIGGKGEVMTLSEFIVFLQASREQHNSLEEKHHSYHVKTSGDAGVVVVDFEWITESVAGGADVFSMGRVGDRWRIVHKLYCM